jgi:hypothetical protein
LSTRKCFRESFSEILAEITSAEPKLSTYVHGNRQKANMLTIYEANADKDEEETENQNQ